MLPYLLMVMTDGQQKKSWTYSGTLENFQGIHRAHRAVVFAVAQLSCLLTDLWCGV